MILYHGSNTDIEHINLSEGLPYKDFGQGFYLTPNVGTAIRMAQKKARLFSGKATLITYEFDETALITSPLNIKRFPPKATAEWFIFVDANRDRNIKHPVHSYDIIIGPIADDGVVLQLTDYHRGLSTPEQAAVALQDKYLDQQYFFGTEAAIQLLRKIKVESV